MVNGRLNNELLKTYCWWR